MSVPAPRRPISTHGHFELGVLDGGMVILAMYVLNICHPGMLLSYDEHDTAEEQPRPPLMRTLTLASSQFS